MLPPSDMLRIILAILVINGVLTKAEAEKAQIHADERLPNVPLSELSMEQMIDTLK